MIDQPNPLPNRAVPPPSRTPYLSLLAADGISQTGSALTMLAIPWFVLETTGSAARTGLTGAVEAVAVVVAGFLGGALVDRIGHKRTSVVSDLISAVTVAAIPVLDHTVGLAFWQLLILVFFGGLLGTPGWSARRSLYEVVARIGNVGLDRANGGAMMANRAAGLGGPLIAGVLVAVVGSANVLWIDAASFVISAALVIAGVPAPAPEIEGPGSETPGERRRYLAEVVDGLRFVISDRLVSSLIVAFALGSLLAEPLYSVILPVYANQVFGNSVALGAMYSGLAAGSIAGNVAFLALAPRLPRRWTIVVGFGVRALAFWVLVPMPPLSVIVVTIAVEAVFLEPTNPIWMTIFQERVPEAVRGRVFGASLALVYAARSVGLLGYGLLLERIGLRNTLVVLAAVNVVVPLMLWLNAELRSLPSPATARRREHALG